MHEVSQGEGSLRLTQPEVERAVRQLYQKIYDAAPLIRRLPAFAALEDEALFGSVEANQGGYGIL